MKTNLVLSVCMAALSLGGCKSTGGKQSADDFEIKASPKEVSQTLIKQLVGSEYLQRMYRSIAVGKVGDAVEEAHKKGSKYTWPYADSARLVNTCYEFKFVEGKNDPDVLDRSLGKPGCELANQIVDVMALRESGITDGDIAGFAGGGGGSAGNPRRPVERADIILRMAVELKRPEEDKRRLSIDLKMSVGAKVAISVEKGFVDYEEFTSSLPHLTAQEYLDNCSTDASKTKCQISAGVMEVLQEFAKAAKDPASVNF